MTTIEKAAVVVGIIGGIVAGYVGVSTYLMNSTNRTVDKAEEYGTVKAQGVANDALLKEHSRLLTTLVGTTARIETKVNMLARDTGQGRGSTIGSAGNLTAPRLEPATYTAARRP